MTSKDRTAENENRLIFMDLLRIAAFAVIISYHFFAELYRAGKVSFDASQAFAGSNMNAVMIAVSLFFLISGAGLAISADANKSVNWKKWYRSHFSRLLIPFYIAFLFTIVSFTVISRSTDYFRGIPLWRLIFSLTATDGYATLLGVRTFYLAVGEWFLGCLVVCYLFFPMIYTAVRKHRRVCLVLTAVIYILLILTYRWHVPIYENLFVKVCSFVLGIVLVETRESAPRAAAIVSALIFFVCLLPRPVVPLPISVKSDLAAVSVFILFMCFEKRFRALVKGDRLSRFASGYTYEIFLIHHSVILMFAAVIPGFKGVPGLLVCAAGCIAVIAVVTHVIKRVEALIWKRN